MEFLYTLPVAFFAGLIDAIAGGGGLIQLPGLLLLFPSLPVVGLLGTNKLASCAGTAMASLHYVRTLKINFKQVLPALISAFIFSALGAKTATLVDNHLLKPVTFALLLLIGIYTLCNKKLGATQHANPVQGWRLTVCCILIGTVMGFYDGFFGPATGSLLIFCFISGLRFDFLHGSAFAKLTNLASNTAALAYFAATNNLFYKLALPMALFNVLGNMIGARLAIKRGSQFVRWVFLIVVVVILGKFAYEGLVSLR